MIMKITYVMSPRIFSNAAKQIGSQFTDNIFKLSFDFVYLVNISLQFLPDGTIDNKL